MKRRHVGWLTLALGASMLVGCSTLLGIDAEYGSDDDAGLDTSGSGPGGAAGSGTGSGQGGSRATGTTGGAAGSTGAAGSEAGSGGATSGAGGIPDAGRDATSGTSTGAGGSAGAGGGGAGGKGGAGGSAGASGGGGAGGNGGAGGVDAGRIQSPIARVQRGSTSIAAGSASQRVTVLGLDPTRSFLVFGARFDGAMPGVTQVSGQITGSTELTFARQTGDMGTSVPISYYVAEFQSGVVVQRGATTLSSASMTATIASVDLARSFPIVSYRNSGSTYGRDDFVRAKLTSATQLAIENTLATQNGIAEWQVATFDGATVQSGDVNLATGDMMVTAPIQTVDPAKTCLFFSYDFGTTMAMSVADLMLRGRIESPTQVAFRRTIPGASGTLTFYAVSFDNGTTVQRASSNVADTASTLAVSLSAIDPLKTILTAGGLYQRGGSTGVGANATPGHATFTLDLDAAGTQISLGRGAVAAGAAATVDWSAVTFR